jgi:superfamily I DNA/RNA helicase
MIFIDESQDFDNTMLKILLEDTTIPKLFVGDSRQAIYEWKGCINAFDKLPDTTLTLEFYSTFRVGNPACDEITNKFNNCWMISKSLNNTILEYNIVPNEKYVYLFRSWKNLLKSAEHIQNIWIYNFDSQVEYIKKLHSRLQISNLDEDELNEFSDDLPKFLLKMSVKELEKMIDNIEKNIVKKEDCVVEMYTIHSYKGLENNIIRIFNDIDIAKEQNLYYVALTRGMKKIIIDSKRSNQYLEHRL